MAINRISGNILQDDLQRGANLAIQGNLIYFDVVSNRVGILTSAPADDFTVIGTANASNVRITSATSNGVFRADTNLLAVTDSNLTFDGTVLTVIGSAVIDNVTIDGTAIASDANISITTAANGNVLLSPDGTGITVIDSETGLALPAGNAAVRPSAPPQGTIRWNTGSGQVEVYDGAQWENVGSDAVTLAVQTIDGDGSTTEFVLDEPATTTSILVINNGVVQQPTVAYTVASGNINFNEAPSESDTISIRFITVTQTVTSISNSIGNAAITVEDNRVGNLSDLQSVQLPVYTVSEANALPNVAPGQIVYVSNGDSGSPCLAVYSAGAWKVLALGGNITT